MDWHFCGHVYFMQGVLLAAHCAHLLTAYPQFCDHFALLIPISGNDILLADSSSLCPSIEAPSHASRPPFIGRDICFQSMACGSWGMTRNQEPSWASDIGRLTQLTGGPVFRILKPLPSVIHVSCTLLFCFPPWNPMCWQMAEQQVP